ncbi:MAG TPA: PilZ domain-containing protein [Gammaproteobacteria bacterium]|nr:PilZ domain-containing protein [Gammaproteobacteria bacterium]
MDRRWSTRKYLSLYASLEVPSYNRTVVGNLRDLSPGGAFIETEVLLPADAPLTLEFRFPGILSQNTFRLNARLIHRHPGGAGIAFVGMSPALIHALSEALSQYELQQEPDIFPEFAMTKNSLYKKRLS